MTEEPGGSLTAAPDLDDERVQQKMRSAFQEVPLHALLDLRVVSIDPTDVVVEMPVHESAFNSTGNLHGGALATLIDVAAGTAAAVGSGFRPGLETIVTADLHVRYLGRPRGDLVRAHARVLKAGRRLVLVECRVLDQQQKVVAAADFSSMIVPLRDPLRPTRTARSTDPDI